MSKKIIKTTGVLSEEKREPYWDYMGRRLKEEKNLSPSERELINLVKLIRRVEELERKVRILGGDPKQLELDV